MKSVRTTILFFFVVAFISLSDSAPRERRSANSTISVISENVTLEIDSISTNSIGNTENNSNISLNRTYQNSSINASFTLSMDFTQRQHTTELPSTLKLQTASENSSNLQQSVHLTDSQDPQQGSNTSKSDSSLRSVNITAATTPAVSGTIFATTLDSSNSDGVPQSSITSYDSSSSVANSGMQKSALVYDKASLSVTTHQTLTTELDTENIRITLKMGTSSASQNNLDASSDAISNASDMATNHGGIESSTAYSSIPETSSTTIKTTTTNENSNAMSNKPYIREDPSINSSGATVVSTTTPFTTTSSTTTMTPETTTTLSTTVTTFLSTNISDTTTTTTSDTTTTITSGTTNTTTTSDLTTTTTSDTATTTTTSDTTTATTSDTTTTTTTSDTTTTNTSDTTTTTTSDTTTTTTSDTTATTTSEMTTTDENTISTTNTTTEEPTTEANTTTTEASTTTTEATTTTTEAPTTTEVTTTTQQSPPTIAIDIVAGVLGVLLLGGLLATGAVMHHKGKLPWNPRNSNASVRPQPISLAKFEAHSNELLNNPARLGSEYQLLLTLSSDVHDTNSVAAAQLPDNKKKNRYINILPYDLTRVKLDITNDDPSSDYINASFIKGFSNNIEYIASQGPKEETVPDFWRMIYQHDVQLIVMVTNLEEGGKIKCDPYLPKLREQMMTADMIVHCITEIHLPVYTQRTIVLHKDDSKRSITHLHFNEWPDFGCPQGTDSMLQFCRTLRHLVASAPGLALVHCSAGVGRTGTLIATDILLQHIQDNKKVDVFGTVFKLRKQRTNMVQTIGQYAYIYKCIRDAILDPTFLAPESPNNSMEPIYENLPTANQKMTNLSYNRLSQAPAKSNSSESECEL